MLKRSLTIAGHRTSLALEPEFWAELEAMARQQQISLAALITRIDEARETPNLSSALRVAVLRWHQQRGAALSPAGNTVTAAGRRAT